jgi:hypothetical protein
MLFSSRHPPNLRPTFVLLANGDSLASLLSLPRPRLRLRLSLRYRPLRRGGGVTDREGLRELYRCRRGERESSDRGDMERVRDLWRPREGDRDRDAMTNHVGCVSVNWTTSSK